MIMSRYCLQILLASPVFARDEIPMKWLATFRIFHSLLKQSRLSMASRKLRLSAIASW